MHDFCHYNEFAITVVSNYDTTEFKLVNILKASFQSPHGLNLLFKYLPYLDAEVWNLNLVESKNICSFLLLSSSLTTPCKVKGMSTVKQINKVRNASNY